MVLTRLPRLVMILAATMYLVATACPVHAEKTLRWNLAAGQSLKVKTQQITHQTAADLVVKSELQVFATWQVLEVESNGVALVHQTIDRITLSMSVPGGDFKFDSSSSESPSGTIQLLAASLTPLVNRTLEMKVTPQGKVTNAQWTEPPKNVPAKPSDKAPPKEPEPELARLRGSIVELPEGTLAEGDTWSAKFNTSLPNINESLDVEHQYTLRGEQLWEGSNVDRIDFLGRITTGRGEEGKSSFDIQREQLRGTILFDSLKGYLVQSESDQQISVDVTAAGQSTLHEISIQTKTEMKEEGQIPDP